MLQTTKKFENGKQIVFYFEKPITTPLNYPAHKLHLVLSREIRTGTLLRNSRCKDDCMALEERDYLRMMGDNVKRIRLSKSLSYRQMSALCKVDFSDISKIEKGKVNITLLTLIELAKALEVQPREIISFEVEFDDWVIG